MTEFKKDMVEFANQLSKGEIKEFEVLTYEGFYLIRTDIDVFTYNKTTEEKIF